MSSEVSGTIGTVSRGERYLAAARRVLPADLLRRASASLAEDAARSRRASDLLAEIRERRLREPAGSRDASVTPRDALGDALTEGPLTGIAPGDPLAERLGAASALPTSLGTPFDDALSAAGTPPRLSDEASQDVDPLVIADRLVIDELIREAFQACGFTTTPAGALPGEVVGGRDHQRMSARASEDGSFTLEIENTGFDSQEDCDATRERVLAALEEAGVEVRVDGVRAAAGQRLAARVEEAVRRTVPGYSLRTSFDGDELRVTALPQSGARSPGGR